MYPFSPRYPTMEQNLLRGGIQCERQLKFKNIILRCILFLHCIPQWNRTFCVVGYNGKDSFAVWATTVKKTPALWDTKEENSSNILRLFHYYIQKWRKTSSVVSYNRRKFPSLHSTMEGNLFCCISQRKKTFFIVSHNGRKCCCVVSRNSKKN